ncbi:MAG TPA: hypothetical protein VF228_25305 [Iamia sp.]
MREEEPPVRSEGDLPARFARRVVVLAPGERCAYVSGDWEDALVVVEDGAIELEDLGGDRRSLARGAVLWLVGLPLRALHNVGRHPAVIVAVSRRLPDRDDER